MQCGYRIQGVRSDIEKTHIERAKAQGWRVSNSDSRVYLAADPFGFYVLVPSQSQKKNNIALSSIGCISCVKYSQDYAAIGCLVIDPEFRKQGLASFMLDKILTSHLNNVTCIVLYAVRTHISLYERFGFKICASLKVISLSRMPHAHQEASAEANSEIYRFKMLKQGDFNLILQSFPTVNSRILSALLDSNTMAEGFGLFDTRDGTFMGIIFISACFNSNEYFLWPFMAKTASLAKSLLFEATNNYRPTCQFYMGFPSHQASFEQDLFSNFILTDVADLATMATNPEFFQNKVASNEIFAFSPQIG
jgi:N-acetylglutamate synthase-like GNAT family acetyltransferase